MARAQPRSLARDCAAARRDERHSAWRSTGRRPANGSTPCARTPRAASCASGRTRSATRTTSPTPASGCRRMACWRDFRTSRRSSISAPASITCSPIPTLPPVPVARVAHPDLTMRVTEYVVLHVLMHHRRQRLYDAQQRERLWRVARSAGRERGCGRRHGARRDRQQCRGGARRGSASRSRAGAARAKTSAGVETFHGDAGLDAFLARTEILVCLLPRTRDTEGHSEPRAVPQAQARWRGRRRVPDQRRARPVAGRCRHRRRRSTKARSPAPRSTCFRRSRCRPKARCGPIPRSPSRRTTPAIFRRACSPPHVIAQIERFERGLPLDNIIDRTRGY